MSSPQRRQEDPTIAARKSEWRSRRRGEFPETPAATLSFNGLGGVFLVFALISACALDSDRLKIAGAVAWVILAIGCFALAVIFSLLNESAFYQAQIRTEAKRSADAIEQLVAAQKAPPRPAAVEQAAAISEALQLEAPSGDRLSRRAQLPEFFVVVHSETAGPFPKQRVLDLLLSGEITEDSPAMPVGASEWQTVATILLPRPGDS